MTKQKLEEITGKFCDKYCRFPYICGNEKQLETVCDSCPMNELFDVLDMINKSGAEKEVEKNCENCAYYDTGWTEPPCCSCRGLSNWEKASDTE